MAMATMKKNIFNKKSSEMYSFDWVKVILKVLTGEGSLYRGTG